MASYRLSPYAYQKLLFMRDIGETEVSGFAITNTASGYPDLITDFQLVKQECSIVTTDMDDDGLSEYVAVMADNGINPSDCMRVWIHTHPGSSPNPSGTDESTFQKLLSKFPFIVMLIISKEGNKFGRIGFTQGCGGTSPVDWDVDWSIPCEAVDFEDWKKEYEGAVKVKKWISSKKKEEAPLGVSYTWRTRKEREGGGASQYRSNYDFIKWGSERDDDEDFLRDVPMFEENAYKDYSKEDRRQILNELDEKSINAMTDEEFELYQKWLDEDED